MQHGKPEDYEAPFKDDFSARNRNDWQSEIDRVVGIGRDRLLGWYSRVKNDTYPGCYGQSGHDWTFGVAYLLNGGAMARYLYEDCEESPERAARIKAAEALGATITLT